MIDKLKSIKEFKDLIAYNNPKELVAEHLINYIDLLDKTLELGQFVPCVDGVPLDRPDGFGMYDKKERIPEEEAEGWYNEWCFSCEQYQEAENKVLFKGVYIEDDFLKMGGNFIHYQTLCDVKGLQEEFEDLIELTEACKQLITK